MDCVYVGWQVVEVDWQQYVGVWCDCCFDVGWVEVVGQWVGFDWYWCCVVLVDCQLGCDVGVGWYDDFVVWVYVQCFQCQFQCIQFVGDVGVVGCVDVCCIGLFEGFEFFVQQELVVVCDMY